MKNLTISRRIALAFFLTLILLFTVAVTGGLANVKLSATAADITGRRLAMFSAGNELTVSLLQSARHSRNMLILDDDKLPAEIASARKQRESRVAPFALIRQGVASPEGKRLVAEIDEAAAAYEGPDEKYLTLIEAHQKEAARAYLLETMRPAQLKLLAKLTTFGEFQKTRMAVAAADMRAEAETTRSVIVAVSVFSLFTTGLVGFALARSIVRPLGQAVNIAEAVARGDLTSDIDAARRDETGRLLAALKTMNTNLAGIVGAVRDSSESIATGSREIAVGNTDLSQRTEEQASNLQQTAASMEQLNGTVRQSAETAREASRLAESASAAAVESGEVVSRFVGTMSDITASSKRIADIISVIDGIAFQTNILALNAAVEAARAGEQGRGFAVVASEVRSLAHRSADAAKEIKQLISESVEKVENGSAMVTEAGKTMDSLVGQVQRVSSMIKEISAASEEQTGGISQVNDAVVQLDQVTQQNAALVEESAAAAESLKHQASRLVESVAVFRLLGPGVTA